MLQRGSHARSDTALGLRDSKKLFSDLSQNRIRRCQALLQRFEQQEAASPAVVASVRVTGTSSIEVAGWLGKSTVQMYVSPLPLPHPLGGAHRTASARTRAWSCRVHTVCGASFGFGA